jgi:hypothetical protein
MLPLRHRIYLEDRTNFPVLPSSLLQTKSIASHSTVRHVGPNEKQRILILTVIVNPDFVTLRTDLVEHENVTPRAKILARTGKFSVLMFLKMTLPVGAGAFHGPWGYPLRKCCFLGGPCEHECLSAVVRVGCSGMLHRSCGKKVNKVDMAESTLSLIAVHIDVSCESSTDRRIL